MAVDHHIKGCFLKGQYTLAVRSPEINPQRQQCLPAQIHIGRIEFGCSSMRMGVVQRKQKRSSTGINVQKPHLRLVALHKDDKFRLISANNRSPLIINLGRLTGCELLEPVQEEDYRPRPLRKEKLVLELVDERNALERCMLHFSHLEKETERIDDRCYRLTLHYEKDDETELLIRVLSFGPVLKVVAPNRFRELLKNRIEKQMKLRTQGSR